VMAQGDSSNYDVYSLGMYFKQ